MTVKIEKTESKIFVYGPYNTLFVEGAKMLAGRWNAPMWVFDIRDQADVVALCMECYGTDGTAVDQVDVMVTVEDGSASVLKSHCSAFTLFGRTVAKATGRDSGAKLGEGIILKSGGFDSGGSAKNWKTLAEDDTRFLMRDVSKKLVDQHSNEHIKVEIVATNCNIEKSGKVELLAELERLESRKAEIINMLNNMVSVPEMPVKYNDKGIHMELADD